MSILSHILNPFQGRSVGDILTDFALPGTRETEVVGQGAFGDSFLDTRGLIAPGNPRSMELAARSNDWNPFSSGPSGWDYIGGGELAEDPDIRRLGRAAGLAVGGYFAAPAIGASFGGESGALGATQASPPAAATFSTGAEGWYRDALTALGNESFGGAGAAGFPGAVSSFPTGSGDSGVFDDNSAPSGDFSPFGGGPAFGDNPEFFPGAGRGSSGGFPGTGGFAPGERGGVPREILDEMLRRNRRTPLMDLASGAYGLYQARDLRRAARDADPMAGYRGQYAKQLSELSADPSKITSMPGYTAGQQAIERRLASQGYLGSGNMMLAMGNYGGDYFNREIARLSALATPSPGAIEGNVAARRAATDQTGRSLATIGRGIYNYNF